MSKFKQLSSGVYVAGQLEADDVARAHAEGIKTIVCNRPDEEGGPPSATLAATARELGLEFVYLPMASPADAANPLDATSAEIGFPSKTVPCTCNVMAAYCSIAEVVVDRQFYGRQPGQALRRLVILKILITLEAPRVRRRMLSLLVAVPAVFRWRRVY